MFYLEQITETEKKIDAHKNSRGETIGTTEHQVQVRKTKEYWRHNSNCKFCDYKWNDTPTKIKYFFTVISVIRTHRQLIFIAV